MTSRSFLSISTMEKNLAKQLLLLSVTRELELVHLVGPPAENHFFQSQWNISIDSLNNHLAPQINKPNGLNRQS